MSAEVEKIPVCKTDLIMENQVEVWFVPGGCPLARAFSFSDGRCWPSLGRHSRKKRADAHRTARGLVPGLHVPNPHVRTPRLSPDESGALLVWMIILPTA